jgi:hypothetical protein
MIAASPWITAQAQNLYKVNFKGTASGVSAAGDEFTQQLNNKTLIREWAARAGVSNQNNLILAYRVGSGSSGDTMELINKKDGSSSATVFILASPETATAETPKGAVMKRFMYMYDVYQPGFSMGTAILNERVSLGKNGATNRFVADADTQWFWQPNGTTNRFRIGSGKFNVTGRPLKFKGN